MKRAFFCIAAISLASAFSPSLAQAYCRTTNCDPTLSCKESPDRCCKIDDASGCETNGDAVFWSSSCVSYNVHEGGSSKRDISASTLARIVDESFDGWLSSECDEGSLSLATEYRGLSQCGSPEFNSDPDEPNANVWMFRDTGNISGYDPQPGMELDSSTLAVSTLSVDTDTGEIYGVDVELNSAIAEFTTSDDDINVDLASIVNHEAGHFLGLDHSRSSGATMGSGYVPGTIGARTLNEDDRAGICATYPMDRDLSGGSSCEPHGGYSPECMGEEGCGCKFVGAAKANPNQGATWLDLSALILGATAARRYSAGAAIG